MVGWTEEDDMRTRFARLFSAENPGEGRLLRADGGVEICAAKEDGDQGE